MTNKNISQLTGKDGTPSAPATSAPGCFVHDGEELPNFPEQKWGSIFSEQQKGNQVEFYVTGEEYFTAVAKAIEGAKKSIFITGWQVNFDVELTAGKTLFECLETAISNPHRPKVYVMPWLSPKVGVDTGDFETVLAIFQLNAGVGGPAKAFALPAIAQSDMEGMLGIGFSHHQKLVVIDNERAFVGGIDLAYGRRDNGKFALSHGTRKGNEVYNTCIPAIEPMNHEAQTAYLTRAELLAGCIGGKVGGAATFATSATIRPIAVALDVVQDAKDGIARISRNISAKWDAIDLMPDFIGKLQDIPIDVAQDISRWAYGQLDKGLRDKVDAVRTTGSAHVIDGGTALMSWLNAGSLNKLPPELRSGTVKLIETFVIGVLTYLSTLADARPTRYENLKKLRKIMPTGAKTFAATQPRMPWHDVHAAIVGPSVSDLSRNFIERWNGIAQRYEKSYQASMPPSLIKMFQALGMSGTPRLVLQRIAAAPPPKTPAKPPGDAWVQVLRSAPMRLLNDELAAHARGSKPAARPEWPQNNCLKAMLTAINGAQKFIYIEGQFFQSEYGSDASKTRPLSGPMAALLDISKSPAYEKYARQLGVYGVPPADMIDKLIWSQIDDVKADITGGGSDFMADLFNVMSNYADITSTRMMGKEEPGILNPIGLALSQRIERAINDGLPFHVYMVLPVHPEGTLDTLNIMTQLHLTMQSLVFGKDSLVNRIRRAILVRDLRKSKKLGAEEARKTVAGYAPDRLAELAGDKWTSYLTLLNLRSWETLGPRHVTEQIYVHSKLLIADDRVAILGSANINDRSQLGGRDSELAVVVRDDNQTDVELDGVDSDKVSVNVHDLRVRLWKKLFGLTDGATPAKGLIKHLLRPAAPDTWEAIQKVALANAEAYAKAFAFLARPSGKPSSIWPTWNARTRSLEHHMPFHERFWRDADILRDKSHSWEAQTRAPESAPVGVEGFIVALPVTWTAGENNISGMNLTLLAHQEKKPPRDADHPLPQETYAQVESGKRPPAGQGESSA